MTEKGRKGPQRYGGFFFFDLLSSGLSARCATVGTGISPVRRLRVRGLYHRYGISPNPKDLLQYMLLKNAVCARHTAFFRRN